MKTLSLSNLKERTPQLIETIPYLKMLVLFGSRARGDTHAKSDWDFAALYDRQQREALIKDPFAWFSVPDLVGQVFGISGDNIDVVDLNRCTPLIAHFVARDGKLIYEQKSGQFERFKQQHLMTDAQLKEVQNQLRQNIDIFLQEWGML